jgi:hypothetical protein
VFTSWWIGREPPSAQRALDSDREPVAVQSRHTLSRLDLQWIAKGRQFRRPDGLWHLTLNTVSIPRGNQLRGSSL